MFVTVVGSGTLLPDAARRSAAHHVQASRASILLDCGSGSLHGLAVCGIDWRGLSHVAITHYHADHVGDLAPLLFALRNGVRGPRTEPLTLLGPPGFGSFMERLAAAMGTYLLDPGFPLDVIEVEVGAGYADPARDFHIWACPTPHTDDSLAFRVQVDDEVVGYTGDTGPSDEVSAFLEDCGLLIAECAWADPCEGEGHLSPERLATFAARARPGLLTLTHVYPPMTAAEAAAQVQARYPGSVVAADDGMRFVPGPDGWAVDHGPSAM